jgi:alkylation response protein AidB-like acyl-CoA dehydrogenase
MNFTQSNERTMLADTLGRFLGQRYSFAARDRIARSPPGFSREMWVEFAELGVIGALFDVTTGGYGGQGFDISVVFEALGGALVVEPFLGTLLAGRLLARAGGRRALVEQIIAGQIVPALAHHEPQSRYDLSNVMTTAVRQGDHWVLNGAKAVVAQIEGADLVVVSARTAGAPRDEAGLSLFFVAANTPGLSVRGYQLIDGGRSGELAIAGAVVGEDAVIGPIGDAYDLIEEVTAWGIVALTAEAVGAMDATKTATVDYLRTRMQFGVPIGKFQALQHRMATILLEIEQARSAVINAAAALDSDRVTRERAVSAAKFTIGRVGTLVAEEAIQMHGGIGMTWELPLAHYAKRLIMIDHLMGDEDHHLERYMTFAAHRIG